MKLQGRTKRELTENDIALCESFLKGTESYDEFAKKNGMTKAQLRYLISRYRTEKAQRNLQEQETAARPAVYKILLHRTLNFPSEETHFEFFRKAISKFPKALLVFMTDNDNTHSEMKKAGNPVTLVKDYSTLLAESHTESKISAYLIIPENVSAYLSLKGLFINALSGTEKEKFWDRLSSVWKNDYLEVSDVDTTVQHGQIINRPVSITMDKCISIVSLETETKTRQASAYCRIYAEADNKKEATNILRHPYYEFGGELTFKKKLRDSLDRYLNLGWRGNPKNAFAVTELRWQEFNDSIGDRLIPSEEFCKKLSRFSPFVMSRWFAAEGNPANCYYGKEIDWHAPVVMGRTYDNQLFAVGSFALRFIQNEMLQVLSRENTEVVMAGYVYSAEPAIVRNVFGKKIKAHEVYTVITHPSGCDVANPFDFKYYSHKNLDGYNMIDETSSIPEVAVPLIEALTGEKVSVSIARKIRIAELKAYAPYIQAAKDSAEVITYPVFYNGENGKEKKDIHTANKIDFFDPSLSPTLSDIYRILLETDSDTTSETSIPEKLLNNLSEYCFNNREDSFDKQKVSNAIQVLKEELVYTTKKSTGSKEDELQRILDKIAPFCEEGMYFSRKTSIPYQEKFIYFGIVPTNNEAYLETEKFLFTRFLTNKVTLNHLGSKNIYFYAEPDGIQFSKIQELIRYNRRTNSIYTGYHTRKLDSEEKINAFMQSDTKVLFKAEQSYGKPYSYCKAFSEEKNRQYEKYFERFGEGSSTGIIMINDDEIPFNLFITKEWMLNMAI